MAKKKGGNTSIEKNAPQVTNEGVKSVAAPVATAVEEVAVELEALALVEQAAISEPETASEEEVAALAACGEAYSQHVKLCREYVIEDNDQVFLVDLDTLVLDVLSSTELDWSCGAPTLQCIYVLEKLLDLLRRNKRVFDVVSFDCFEQFVLSPAYRFVRALLARHIATQTDVSLVNFKGWWTPAYTQYFKARQIAFVVVGDANLTPSIAAGYDAKLALYMKTYTLELLSASQRACRSSEMGFGVTTITAFEMFITETETRATVRALLPSALVVNLARPVLDAATLTALTPAVQGAGAHANRRFVLAYACTKALEELTGSTAGSISAVEVARLVTLHGLILETLPVAQRSQRIPTGVPAVDELRDAALLPFLTAAYPHATAALTALGAGPRGSESVLDVLDGRLLLKLTLLLASDHSLAASVVGMGLADGKAAERLWAGVRGKNAEGLFPVLIHKYILDTNTCTNTHTHAHIHTHTHTHIQTHTSTQVLKLALPKEGLMLEPTATSFLGMCVCVCVCADRHQLPW
jgi:hypothetical protein